MTVTYEHLVCRTPDLCLIACPWNRVLAELGESVCDPQCQASDGEDEAILVVYGDSANAEESS